MTWSTDFDPSFKSRITSDLEIRLIINDWSDIKKTSQKTDLQYF